MPIAQLALVQDRLQQHNGLCSRCCWTRLWLLKSHDSGAISECTRQLQRCVRFISFRCHHVAFTGNSRFRRWQAERSRSSQAQTKLVSAVGFLVGEVDIGHELYRSTCEGVNMHDDYDLVSVRGAFYFRIVVRFASNEVNLRELEPLRYFATA